MKKSILTLVLSPFFALLLFLPAAPASAVTFDQGVLKATLQVQIYDNYTEQGISAGTGVAIGGELGAVLTNHHVAELIFANPDRYKAFGCLTYTINTEPDCKLLLSPTPDWNNNSPKYNQNFDLALLYVSHVYEDNEWRPLLSFDDRPIVSTGFSTVVLSSYTEDFEALGVGDAVHAVGYPDYGNGTSVQVSGTVLRFDTDPGSGQVLAASDFATSFGNSGGPVFNSSGELVGIAVACYVDENDKCTTGLFIPMPTVHWWYTNVTGNGVSSWGGEDHYGDPSDEVGPVMCHLRANAHYDATVWKDGCTCDAGWERSVPGNTDCDVYVGADQPRSTPPSGGHGSAGGSIVSPRQPEVPEIEIALPDQFNGENAGGAGGGSIPAPPPNYDKECKSAYGPESYWDGGVDDAAQTFSCSCDLGYQFNDADTHCVAIPEPVELATESETQTASLAMLADWDENRPSDKQNETPVPQQERRGFWSWLLSLFGF